MTLILHMYDFRVKNLAVMLATFKGPQWPGQEKQVGRKHFFCLVNT